MRKTLMVDTSHTKGFFLMESGTLPTKSHVSLLTPTSSMYKNE